jgi:hypothetical protein
MAGRNTRQWMSYALGLLFLGGFMATPVLLRAAEVIARKVTTTNAASAITAVGSDLLESPADLQAPRDTR